ncbi:MAG: bifunctional nuclease domain-containing protein [Candidatus Algichlamydia australiensis]|nr:bifunctional nuclease domain-containing protein [Chlamydiales bacterium]
MSGLIPIHVEKILQGKTYSAFILQSETMRFAIFTEPHVGANIQKGSARPKTAHDLVSALLHGLEVKPLKVVIDDVEEAIYSSKLFVEQENQDVRQILEIAARPSDCLTLVMLQNIPLFVEEQVLDKVTPYEE